jgi:hypothetical protein
MDESVLLMSVIRRNNRLLLTLVIAWSMLLGAAHALHAVYHLSPTGTVSATGDHACALCLLDRNGPVVTPQVTGITSVPEPALLPLVAPTPAGAATPSHARDALSPCAGRAPPVLFAS